MTDQNYSFGEASVTSTYSSKHATVEEIVAISKQIWTKVVKSKFKKDDDENNDKLLEELQAEFKDFNISFPLVLRWMVQMRKFSVKVFEKYLLKHSSAKLNTREEFLELQAEYLVLLFREENSHPDENAVKRYRASIVKELLSEDKRFMELQKEVEKDIEKQDSQTDVDRRRRLYEFILAQKVAQE